MHKVPAFTLFIIFLAAPAALLAMEQSFTQNGLTAVIRLSPDELIAGKSANLALKLENEGQPVSDRTVSLEVCAKDAAEPVVKRGVDFLEDEYIDSWTFEKPGDYRVALDISDPREPGKALHYEIKASVGEANDADHEGHEEHGFFSRHFSGKSGWVMGGMMLLIMVPMMIIML